MQDIKKQISIRKFWNDVFMIIGLLFCFAGLLLLAVLIIDLFVDGRPRLSLDFFLLFPSRHPEQAGIFPAWVGTLWVITITALVAVPIGVAAGIYLEEYAPKNWFTSIIEININNLAGVPSIIYGLLAVGLFVYFFGFGESVLTGGLTLAILILPIVIIATREAIRAVPNSIREASYALGATKWQTVRWHILPYATGGILTGVIIGLSRAIGETAPLIAIGALMFVPFLPSSPFDPFTVLPIQVYNWVSRPQHEFHVNAAAAGTVLLVITLLMNAIAIYIRYRIRRKIRW